VPSERETGLVSLLQEASRAATEAENIVGAARRVLGSVCRATGWPLGHLCLPDDRDRRVFRSTDVWHIDGPDSFDGFRAASTGLRFPIGVGIIGATVQAAMPVWSPDVRGDPNFIRGRAALADGIMSAVAVLEFFTSTRTEPDAAMLGVMTDVGTQLSRVADRLAAQRQLANSAHRLERFMDSSVEAFVSMDEAGLITAWNKAAERMFGIKREDAISRNLAETMIPPRLRDAHHFGVGRFLTTGERHVLDSRIEITAWHPDGYEFPVELAIWAVKEEAGWLFNAFIHDITERKNSEVALRAAYEHEREAVAMLRELDVAKREFVANVSHELRTPLANVIGHLEVLSAGDAGELNKQQTRMLDVINRNAERLRLLIEDLLTISKVEAGAFDLSLRRTDLETVLKAAFAAVEPRARNRSHRMSLAFAGDLGSADVDAEQLQRALMNLLLNAVNYTPDGGEITLSARCGDDSIEIAVVDNGIGISETDMPRLFQRFFRGEFAVREAVQGAGLGLAITKTIIEGHGGTIVVKTAPDEGTTFTMLLPRGRRQSPVPAGASATSGEY
jgi:PAS domain S-box-containing protein